MFFPIFGGQCSITPLSQFTNIVNYCAYADKKQKKLCQSAYIRYGMAGYLFVCRRTKFKNGSSYAGT